MTTSDGWISPPLFLMKIRLLVWSGNFYQEIFTGITNYLFADRLCYESCNIVYYVRERERQGHRSVRSPFIFSLRSLSLSLHIKPGFEVLISFFLLLNFTTENTLLLSIIKLFSVLVSSSSLCNIIEHFIDPENCLHEGLL